MSSPHAVPESPAPSAAPFDLRSPPAPLAERLDRHWMLDPGIDFLNHGSFGALPRRVAEVQVRLREFIESRPIERLGRRCRELLMEPRAAVARFVGASPEDLGFVTNATEGVNAVLRSLALEAGDELVTTDHVYNAVRQSMRYVARRAGARVIEVPIPVPLESAEVVAGRLLEHIGPRTRLVILDYVSSPTALRFPVEMLVPAIESRGIPVLIDGAHAPGMLPLDLTALGCSYFAANLHKWVCAPKGCAILVARRDRQADLHPPIVSHFLDQGFTREFDWQGTRDITPWLCAPEALAFMDDRGIGLGWNRVMEHNHRLARWVQTCLCTRWGVRPLTSEASAALDSTSAPVGAPSAPGPRAELFPTSQLGAMATVELPSPLQPDAGRYRTFEELQLALCEGHRIEVPVVEWNGRRYVRPCCQVYNLPEQYERLGRAVELL